MTTDVHLFVLVHGLWGGAGHLKSVEDTLKTYVVDSKEELHILRPTSSALFKTYDGIEIIGQRMLLEVLKEIKKLNDDGTTVKKISFVGYSLGGLVSRYIIGELDRLGIFEILEPQYFATFATPHVGTWFFKKRFSIMNFLGSNLIGLVGSEIFIKDRHKIILTLSEGVYIEGLKKFKRRFAFSNVRHDRTVNFYTSFITDKNPFDQHWENLDLEFEFEENLLPTYTIKGLEVQPKIVNLSKSTFRPIGFKKEKPTLFKKLRYASILLLVSFVLPFWIPIVFTASTIGSIVSFFIVKTYKKPNLDELKPLIPGKEGGSSELDSSTTSVDFRERLDEAAGEAIENALNLAQYDSTTESARDVSKAVPDKTEETSMKEKEALEAAIDNFFKHRDEIFKNPKTDNYEIFQETERLPLDDDRATIVKNLNELDWYKFAVYVNVLNAHDGIIARKGMKRSTVKGIALISLFAQIINREIKESYE